MHYPKNYQLNYHPISVSQYPFRPQKRKIFGKRINGTGQKKDPPLENFRGVILYRNNAGYLNDVSISSLAELVVAM